MKVSKNICIVDDDPIHVMLMEKLIEKTNSKNNVINFSNGKIAFDTLLEKHKNSEGLPEIILLDINMPVWDGWDFIHAFTQIEQFKKIKIYIVTSSNHTTDIQNASKYDIISEYIVKPLSVDKIKEIIG